MGTQKIEKRVHYDKHAFEWESSRIKQTAYCKENALDYQTFITARSRLQASRGRTRKLREPRVSPFTEVKSAKKPLPIDCTIAQPHPPHLEQVTLLLPTGAKLSFPSNLTQVQISVWMHALVDAL